METCFVSSTRRNTTRPLVSSPRPHGATLDLSLETTGEAVVVHIQTAKLTYPVLSAFFEEVRGILEDGVQVAIGAHQSWLPFERKSGLRFSMKAAAPSIMSGEPTAWRSMPRPDR